jgi:hypothetical protein
LLGVIAGLGTHGLKVAVGPRAKSLDSWLMSAITGETDSLAKMIALV